ncbi:transposase [uncultured Anaerococcus sp.]|uniref:transposase n=1 Tax=uncultured Anaerococcus sp. TaxID=293428 RepID=UPI001CBF7245
MQSTTDSVSGLFHKGNHKEAYAYSIQTSCDKNGWILGYKAYPANLHDSTTFPSFFNEKLEKYQPEKIVIDAGYKIPSIAKELVDKGIMPVLPYIKPKGRRNDKESFYPKQYKYDQTNDCYIYSENKILLYSTTNREGYRIYKSKKSLCENCPSLSKCTKSKSKVKVIIRHIRQEYIDYCE